MAYAAIFAALAIYVFWGTWSMGFAPVMPDCPTVYPSNYLQYRLDCWLERGRFIPTDILIFLGSPYFWQEFQYAFAMGLSGFALALFLKRRGLSSLASFGSGLLLAFCGYWSSLFSAGHLGWFQWMTYGVFSFYLIERALEEKKLKYFAWLGAVSVWGGFYQADLWFLFTFFTGIYFLYRLLQLKVFPWKGILVAFIFFVLIGLPSFKSALVNDLEWRKGQIEKGETLSAGIEEKDKQWIFVTNWSLPPDETLEFLIPRINGDTSCPLTLHFAARAGKDTKAYTGALGRPYKATRGNYRQHSLYVGFITCLFALLGLVTSWRKCLFFAIAAVVFYLFSLGRYCEPVYRLVYSLPFGDILRAPVKWHHLTEFCLVILAAYGIDFLVSFKTKFKFAPFVAAGIVLLGAIDLARIDKLYCAPVSNLMAQRIGMYQYPIPDAPNTLSIVFGSISLLASLALLGTLKYEK